MSNLPDVLPQDEHDAELVANVHPSDWENPEPAERYNLVVIGAGTAGLVTAAGAAGLGARVALVERHLLGGDCLNVGCVPSKCMIRSARASADVRQAERFGVRVPDGVEADFGAVMERMRRLRADISHHDSAARFRDLGVDVFLGEGRFSGPDTVEVDGRKLRFRKAVIATGARAYRPPVPGLEGAGYLTNETVFSLTKCPRRLVVFGAGPLGCELAQVFQRLGSQVTIVQRGPALLPREDPDAAAVLTDAFRRDGIEVALRTEVEKVEVRDQQKLVHVLCDGNRGMVEADEILVGAGRQPNVEGLNLDLVGVRYDARHGVVVDDRLRTTNRRIFAAGDICLEYRFTHAADAAARIVIANALFWGRGKLSALTVPWCTYTDPEIAHVGMYEKDAEEAGFRVDTYLQPMADVDRAIADGEGEGFVKVHVRKGTDKLLGATIVARHAGEMISELTLAMVGGVGLKTISATIHPYPTQAEAIRKVADAYQRTRLTPFVKKLFDRLLAWQR